MWLDPIECKSREKVAQEVREVMRTLKLWQLLLLLVLLHAPDEIVAACPVGYVESMGMCVPQGSPVCPANYVLRNGLCYPVAPSAPNNPPACPPCPPCPPCPVQPVQPLPVPPSQPCPLQPSQPCPLQPVQPYPVQPAQPCPLQPVQTFPVPPAQLCPLQPAQPCPLQPSQPCPLQPSQPCPLQPSQPCPLQPAQPCPHQPAQPFPVPPAQLCPLQPSQPCPLQPTQPCPLQPAQPCPLQPAQPCPVLPIYPGQPPPIWPAPLETTTSPPAPGETTPTTTAGPKDESTTPRDEYVPTTPRDKDVPTTPGYVPTTYPPEELARCPEGTVLIGGVCRLIYCGKGGVYRDRKCIRTRCPAGTVWTGVQCASPEPIVQSIVLNNTVITHFNRTGPAVILNNVNNLVVNATIDMNGEGSSYPAGSNCSNVDSGEEEAPSPTDETSSSSPAQECCIVVGPRQCQSNEAGTRWNCFNKRFKRCGDFCIAPTIYLKPPMVRNTGHGLVMPPDHSLSDCRRERTCADSHDYYDCSGCEVGMPETCSSYCYRSTCGTRSCQYYDQRRYCERFPGQEGCHEADGCADGSCSNYYDY